MPLRLARTYPLARAYPQHYRLVRTLLQLVSALVTLAALPFGYECTWDQTYSERCLRRAFTRPAGSAAAPVV